MRSRRWVPLLACLVAGSASSLPAAAGGGIASCDEPLRSGRGSEISIRRLCFQPAILRVPPGTEVTFVNRERVDIEHDVVGPGWTWGSRGYLDEEDRAYRHRFTEPGVFPFHCSLHPGMVGAVVVGNAAGGLVRPALIAAGSGDAATERSATDPAPSDKGLAAWTGVTAAAVVAILLLGAAVAAASRRSARGGTREPLS